MSVVYLLLGQVILLKESQRASQRVDYSTYVHDEDEGDMHYADNILPHDLHHKEVPASLILALIFYFLKYLFLN